MESSKDAIDYKRIRPARRKLWVFKSRDIPDAAGNMSNRTLVAIGLTRTDGAKGFVILTDRVNKDRRDLANGEELLDSTCHVAVAGRKGNAGLIDP